MAKIKIAIDHEKSFFFPNGRDTLYFVKEKMGPAVCIIDENKISKNVIDTLKKHFRAVEIQTEGAGAEGRLNTQPTPEPFKDIDDEIDNDKKGEGKKK